MANNIHGLTRDDLILLRDVCFDARVYNRDYGFIHMVDKIDVLLDKVQAAIVATHVEAPERIVAVHDIF